MDKPRTQTTIVTAAALVGVYVSQHMFLKALRARRGELTEASVVETPAGNLFFGQPNALFGLVFYATILGSTPLADRPRVRAARRVAASLAMASSVYLAYSLLFVTRMSCPYCWTGHAANAVILTTLLSES